MSFENPSQKETVNEKTVADYEKMDFYQRLGLSRDASQEDIKKAYRKIAQKYHPDVQVGGKDTTAILQVISEAYTELSNPEKKKKYDLKTSYRSASSSSRSSTSSNFHRWYQDFEKANKQWNDDFDSKFGNWREARQEEKKSPEQIKEEALKNAELGSYYFDSYIKNIKKEDFPGVQNFVNSPEIKAIILKTAISTLRTGLYYYDGYMSGWAKDAGFDRSSIDTSEEIRDIIKEVAITKAKEGVYWWGLYIKDVEKYGLGSKKDLLKNEAILNTIRQESIRKAVEGAYWYGQYLSDWKKNGLDREIIDNDPQVLGIIKTNLEIQKGGGEYFYKSFIKNWKDAGINLE